VTDDRDLFIFTAMRSIVQPVERVIEDAQRFHLIQPKILRMVCAWCEPGVEGGETITHGICPACLARMEVE
jgi:hypothetical protein